jgi:NAD(P)-dependent dehydrogenase (short-subunit alcohol dehydrogenase family)
LQATASRKTPLVKDSGSIVFMSSVAATHGQTGMSLYCASKGAIESLTRAAAVELAPRRIRVNAIRAGAFASPMHTRITQGMTEAAIDAYAAKHLFGFGRPEDVAHAVVFLLSDMAKWVTGSIFTIDGGYSAK